MTPELAIALALAISPAPAKTEPPAFRQAPSLMSYSPTALVWTSDYNTAMAERARTKTPLLIDFQTKECLHCRTMDAMIDSDPEIQSILRRFVCVRIDGEVEKKLLESFAAHKTPIDVYPTFLVIAPDSKRSSLRVATGDVSPQVFKRALLGAERWAKSRMVATTTVSGHSHECPYCHTEWSHTNASWGNREAHTCPNPDCRRVLPSPWHQSRTNVPVTVATGRP